ncbi:histidine phosphatase family protein [Nocardia nepalensis]|uniref:histidine phosphatase family protein n=1 Tax=Nocardia nepalensis TaxID=3375448 RepID=UPI003B66F5C4
MNPQLDRRSMLGLTGAATLVPVLAACGGGKHKHEKPVASATPVSPPPSAGALPDMVMIIRHAEKPNGSGTPYGITEAGERDEESLTVRGWTRAGALVELFDPRAAGGSAVPTRQGISRPATIFASSPGGHGSKRPQQTVSALAAALDLQVDLRFAKGQEADLAAALPGIRGPVLISWQHENIGVIIAHLGGIEPTPPKSWPDERFDVVYVFARNGNGWTFTQIPQLLLSGDLPTPIR